MEYKDRYVNWERHQDDDAHCEVCPTGPLWAASGGVSGVAGRFVGSCRRQGPGAFGDEGRPAVDQSGIELHQIGAGALLLQRIGCVEYAADTDQRIAGPEPLAQRSQQLGGAIP